MGESIDKSAALAVARRPRGARRIADLPESVRRQTLPLLVPHPAIKLPNMPYALVKDEACYAGEPVALRDRGQPLHRGGRRATGSKWNTSRCLR